MRWEEKMDAIIKEIYGDDYGITVVNDSEFNVYYLGKLFMNIKTVQFLSAHWRKELIGAIIKIIDFKVAEVYKKY